MQNSLSLLIQILRFILALMSPPQILGTKKSALNLMAQINYRLQFKRVHCHIIHYISPTTIDKGWGVREREREKGGIERHTLISFSRGFLFYKIRVKLGLVLFIFIFSTTILNNNCRLKWDSS